MIWLAWILQAIVVLAYLLSAKKPKRVFYFHVANSICGTLLFVIYAMTDNLAPIPLNLAFTIIGTYALFGD